jgi:aspartyl-tRNA(Asn)/glutamyl-tRNA(Gln) amidotransferase subunit B
VESWTLDWDADNQRLNKMRSKETIADYRYFREPDLLPLEMSEAWRDEVLAELPELPLERQARFRREYELPEYDADILTGDKPLSEYFETAIKAYGGDPKIVSNWIMNEILRMINELGVSADELVVSPENLAKIIQMVDAGKINNATAKSLITKVQETGKPPKEIVTEEGLAQVSDDLALQAVIDKILAEKPEEVASYRGGKEGLFGWFMGQVMRETRGKADPQLTRELLQKALKGK